MSIRAYFDNSFLHDAHAWSEGDCAALSRAFVQQRRYSLYLSAELFIEMVAIWNTPRRDRLASKASPLLRLMPSSRLLEYGGTLVRRELCGEFRTPFRPFGDSGKLQGMLAVISQGRFPSHVPAVLSGIQSRKQDDARHFQGIKDLLRSDAIARFGSISPRRIAFDDFYSRLEGEVLQSLLEVQRRKGRHVPPDVSKVLTRPERYRYTLASLKAPIALSYLHAVENHHVDEGDGFDVQQLVYLVNLDVLVTGDGVMRKLCEYMYGGRCRIMSPKGFVETLKFEKGLPVRPSTGSGRTVEWTGSGRTVRADRT